MHNSSGSSANKQWQMWIHYLRASHWLSGMCPSSIPPCVCVRVCVSDYTNTYGRQTGLSIRSTHNKIRLHHQHRIKITPQSSSIRATVTSKYSHKIKSVQKYITEIWARFTRMQSLNRFKPQLDSSYYHEAEN